MRMSSPTTEVTPAGQPASPTGQMVGLSKLFNDLPPSVQNAIASVIGIAALLVLVNQAAPGMLPPSVVGWSAGLAGLGGAIGIISGGVRK